MESDLIKMAATQGIWSFLSIFLIFYIFKNQQKRDEKQDLRESKYQDIIDNLTNSLKVLEKIEISIASLENRIK